MHRNLSLLSIVVPCLDEELVIATTHSRILSALDTTTGFDLEIIYVDDGSQDSTLTILRELQQADQRVKVISLSRNFGQFAALTAGMQHATGDVVALIDADLQDPPEIIPEMLELWQQGADIVQGLRTKRHGEKKFKVWSSRIFMRIFKMTSDTKFTPGVGDFMIIDRAVTDALMSMPESRHFLRCTIPWLGFNHEILPFEREERVAGKTKYSSRKLTSLAIDSILSFSIAPLRIATWIGLLLSGFAFAGILYTLVIWLFDDAWVPGWAMVLVTILALNGLQLLFLGIIGEYLGRTYGEVKRYPLYLVKERLGFAPERHRRIISDNNPTCDASI